MKFFPKKLSLKWINQAYDNNELTPYELVDEILKRAEENKDKNIWLVAPSRELMEKYISKLPPRSEDKPVSYTHLDVYKRQRNKYEIR